VHIVIYACGRRSENMFYGILIRYPSPTINIILQKHCLNLLSPILQLLIKIAVPVELEILAGFGNDIHYLIRPIMVTSLWLEVDNLIFLRGALRKGKFIR